MGGGGFDPFESFFGGGGGSPEDSQRGSDLRYDMQITLEEAAFGAEKEIEVRIRAAGINFRDLMKALGTYPGNPTDLLWFGDDVAGVVERVGPGVRDLKPGDEIAGMAPYGFRSFAVTDTARSRATNA